jgi:uncharacterized phage protein (predicted DNA packaging)
MKISEVTTDTLIDYLRIDEATEIEESEIERMKASSISFISGYTGLTVEELDDFEDLTQALFVLVADMFDNRNMQTDKAVNVNKMVDRILGMHSVNLL